MTMGRAVRRTLLVLLLLAVAAGAWMAWRAWQVRDDLAAASTSATQLRQALTGGDQAAAEAELAALQEHATSAADHTDGPIWSLAEQIPYVGDDAEAIAVVSRTTRDLAEEGLPPIVDSAAQLDAGSFAPKNGKMPVDGIAALQEPVAQASAAFAEADDELQSVETTGLLDVVGTRLAEVTDQVGEADATLAAAERAVEVLPGMLGQDGVRSYLLAFQNNAEVRAPGGMPGAMSLLAADNGRITLGRQVAPVDFPVQEQPVLPLTDEERTLFGPQLGTYIQDANFTPDFPRTAELMAAHWERNFDTPLDGVIAIDPVAVSYLLAVTGPVTVDGVTLTADNAVDELLNGTYLRLEDPREQDTFFRNVAQQVFTAVVSGTGDPTELVRALARGVEERRLLVSSFDDAEQAVISGSTIAGEFPTDATDRPQVGVHLNDATGSKMSYYLDYTVEVAPTTCTDGTQQLDGQLTIASNTPPDAANLPVWITGGGLYGVPAGSQIVVADLFAPAGGSISDLALDGKNVGAKARELDGRPVAQVVMFFEPGQELEVTWTMESGPDQPGDIDVTVTPGVQPENESSVVLSGCS